MHLLSIFFILYVITFFTNQKIWKFEQINVIVTPSILIEIKNFQHLPHLNGSKELLYCIGFNFYEGLVCFFRCSRNADFWTCSLSKNEINNLYPYTFTNKYDKNKYHGLGYHQDDVKYFSVVIVLTKDKGNGVLQIKDIHNNNNIINIEMNAGDAIIMPKGVWHQVPIVKRDIDRISINLFYWILYECGEWI